MLRNVLKALIYDRIVHCAQFDERYTVEIS
jgi:hypothetical protein